MIVTNTYFSFHNNMLHKSYNMGKITKFRPKNAMNIVDRIKRSVANRDDGVAFRDFFGDRGNSLRWASASRSRSLSLLRSASRMMDISGLPEG